MRESLYETLALKIDELVEPTGIQDHIIGTTIFKGKEYAVLDNDTLIRYCFVNGFQVATFKDNELPKDLVIEPT